MVKTIFRLLYSLMVPLLLSAVALPAEENKTRSGECIVEPPTLVSLGFEWRIDGDDNRNAGVAVQYRKPGEDQWREALPLLRLQREKMVNTYGAYDYVTPNMFAGGIMDLQEDTEHEILLRMTDPDGVENGTDCCNACPPGVKPGDTILVHAGIYREDRYRYAHQLGLLFDGTYRFRRSVTAVKPIAIVGAGDGEAIFDGAGNPVLYDVMGADCLYFEGLTVRTTEAAFQAGHKGVAVAAGVSVKNCRLEQVGRGIYSDWSGSKNLHIADNTFIGKSHPERL